ncbi:sodium-dependent transporter [bacterium]|nr:sodium-dependent transporter [bacterium]
MQNNRGNFSKIGFIMAAAGSAVGLGNLWRFPYAVGENGGGVFVLIYLISVVVIALPVLMAEVTLGRFTGKNPVGAFNAIKPGSPWKFVGYLGVASGLMILSFYAVIAGGAVGYFFKALTGQFKGMASESAIASNAATEAYQSFAGNGVLQIFLLAIFIILTVYVVSKGVSGGIEKYSKILMPALIGILFLLLFRSLTLEGASKGVAFYIKPDWSALKPSVIINAMGQAFFSLSLGMGTMITYGSYVSKKENIPSATKWIAVFDTGIAIMAGFIIFPAIFSLGMQDVSGPGTMFNVLPVLFDKMPGGMVFGPLFFLLLSIAALTSTISILEVPVAFCIDEKKWDRKKASIIVGAIALAIGVPCALSESFLGVWSTIWGGLSLSIGALFVAIFIGFSWKTPNALKEMYQGADNFKGAKVWSFAIKYIAPVFILAILLSSFLL